MSNPRAGTGNSLGLAVGATNLAGTSDRQRPVIRPAAVTLDRGHVLTGFVDRVGDPVPMVAQDGSQHRPELLLVEALDGLARSHRQRGAGLRGRGDGSRSLASLCGRDVACRVADQAGAEPVAGGLGCHRRAHGTAVGPRPAVVGRDRAVRLRRQRHQHHPGRRGREGCSHRRDGPRARLLRRPDRPGDPDQGRRGDLRSHRCRPVRHRVVGSLARLRDECRRAKERLSDETATGIPVDLPGLETTVRLTRMELDDLIDGQLAEFVAVLIDTLDRHRVPLASISAVATVGGGARIPLITQRLSQHLRTRVVTTPLPQLTAAAGVALIAQRSQIVESATALAPAAPATGTVAAAAVGVGGPPAAIGALAWSEVDDDPADALGDETHYRNPYVAEPNPYVAEPGDSRPELEFTHEEWEDGPSTRRRGQVVLAGVAAAAVLVGAVVFGLTRSRGARRRSPRAHRRASPPRRRRHRYRRRRPPRRTRLRMLPPPSKRRWCPSRSRRSFRNSLRPSTPRRSRPRPRPPKLRHLRPRLHPRRRLLHPHQRRKPLHLHLHRRIRHPRHGPHHGIRHGGSSRPIPAPAAPEEAPGPVAAERAPAPAAQDPAQAQGQERARPERVPDPDPAAPAEAPGPAGVDRAPAVQPARVKAAEQRLRPGPVCWRRYCSRS